MKYEYKKELTRLTPRQHRVVVDGLTRKLSHYEKTGVLPYDFDSCSVCKDMGSTAENPKCEQCYIQKSCQAPFNEGFKEDTLKGGEYFEEMLRFLGTRTPPEIAVVGGTWDELGGRPSKVVAKMAGELKPVLVRNGGDISDLPNNLRSFPLVVWMPNISNHEQAMYPQKGVGSVMVISKVMRPGYTKADSVSRIFPMKANAVIEIRQGSGAGKFILGLRDSLANWWAEPTTDFVSVITGIMDLYWWTKSSIRASSVRLDSRAGDVEELIGLTSKLADQLENELGERYFGNVSTRCQSLFPGVKVGRVFVSPRNSDKKRLGVEDMVLVNTATSAGRVQYFGVRKPSVDTPIQLGIFREFQNINYLIHGHARIKNAPTTKEYFPCGDLRAEREIVSLIRQDMGVASNPSGRINLLNHGFLLYSKAIEDMRVLVKNVEFEEPNQ